MNKLLCILLALACACASMGCVDEQTEVFSPTDQRYGCVEFVDDMGARQVCDVYYTYYEGSVVYYDPYFAVWIGPQGYWWHGGYHTGFWGGYRAHYGVGYYHSPGYYHGGGHGYYHGGGGRGGGGHRR